MQVTEGGKAARCPFDGLCLRIDLDPEGAKDGSIRVRCAAAADEARQGEERGHSKRSRIHPSLLARKPPALTSRIDGNYGNGFFASTTVASPRPNAKQRPLDEVASESIGTIPHPVAGSALDQRGVRRNPRGCPPSVPRPTICPYWLTPDALSSTHPDPGGISVFKSVIVPFSKRRAW